MTPPALDPGLMTTTQAASAAELDAIRALDAGAAPRVRLPEELRHPFRLVAVDWEALVGALDLLDPLLALGVRVVIFAGEDLAAVVAAAGAAVRGPHARRLHVGARSGGALFTFDRRGRPVDLRAAAGAPAQGAVERLLAEVIASLRIGAHDVLVVTRGASFTSRDASEARDVDANDAPAVSGGGAMLAGVRLSLDGEGGARRLREALELQRALDAELGAFAPPRDAAWVVEEAGFDRAREHEIESLLGMANGYLGTRGSIAEGSSVSRPATFIAGAFEPSADMSQVPELVIAPDWGRMRFVIEGEPFSVERSEVLHHRRTLDMRRGVLLRDCVARGEAGHLVHLRTLHAASLAERHVLLEAVSLSPLNFTGAVGVEAILCGDVRSASGAAHWESFVAGVGPRSLWLLGRTRGGLTAAMTSQLHADEPPGAPPVRSVRTPAMTSASERAEIDVRVGERRDLYRTVTLHTSRDLRDPCDLRDLSEKGQDPSFAGEELRARIEAAPVREVLRAHERAWAERWRRADVEIDGAPKIERALRFALYHLISTANPDDPRCSIGARALSGEAYRGHVFWDTEVFMLPFFTWCYPEAARAMLRYRHLTLPGARRKAAALGYAGALYAWESTDTGDETTPAVVMSPLGQPMRVLSGAQEHHISADVAYAAWCHARVTGDEAFARGEGLEILVETARFWASRGALGEDGRFHIRKVIGPDEYHEEVDDNAFTNWMARHNLRVAAEAAAAHPEAAARLGVRPEEALGWVAIADRMVLGVDEATGLIEQFAGYFGLAPFAIADYAVRTAPIDLLLGRAKTQACQVVKQSDVVQLLALLWDEIPAEARRANFLYYEPRTAHGSSLSPGIHALVAARLELPAQVERYFDQTADIDLGNNMGNAAGGVHAAGLGSLWQAVVFGAAGVHLPARGRGFGGAAGLDPAKPLSVEGPEVEELVIEPHLPAGWRCLRVPVRWRGRQVELQIEPDAVEVAVLEGDRPLPLRLVQGDAQRAVVAEPGRRYAAARGDGSGVRSWEEIEP